MADIHANVVLIADVKNPQATKISEYFTQKFSSLVLLQISDNELEEIAVTDSVCIFIDVIDSTINEWQHRSSKILSPLVSVIAYSTKELDPVAAMASGYSDVVAHGNLEHLMLVIGNQLSRFDYTAGLLSSNRGLSYSDFTGVHSRLEFLESVTIIASEHTSSHAAILYLQLDNFTWINENLGMAAGDHYLKDVGNSLNSITKDDDFVARYQGGNFILYVTADSQNELSSKADMVRETIHELSTEYGTNLLSSTASIGVRMFAETITANELIANAYDASDIAKSNGGDTVHYYRKGSDDSAEAVSKRTWNERIKQAFDDDLFILYFQPIVNLMSESSPRYEVLLRMQDQQQAIIAPGTFLPYAERAGLMADIDRKVIHQSLSKVIEHRAEMDEQPELFIKLSGKSVDDTGLASWIANTLQEMDYPADKIVFEITESIALHHLVQTRLLCSRLRELGVKVALDHFGTRFRSFKLLQDLKVDYLKIDGSIVQHLSTNKGHQAIVKRIVKIAQNNSIDLVACSVQEASSLPLIWQYDIAFVQGFFLGVPTEKMDYDFRNMLI